MSRRTWIWVLVGALWLGTASTGMWALWAYENTPGDAAAARERWPADAGLSRAASGPTLVMLLHPRCTCSRASVDELREVVARVVPPRTYVLMLRPEGLADGWEKTDLWTRAASIPGVTVVADPHGAIAGRFGAATSGQTFVYDAEGVLRFSGGLTAARGVGGNNAGRATVLALLANGTAGSGRSWTSVFGCSLFGRQSARTGA